MGFRGINIGSIILILTLAFLLFGGKRLKTLGEDIGTALRGLRKGLHEEPEQSQSKDTNKDA